MKDLEITEKIIEACFEVHNELGNGFLEKVYENALAIALRDKGLAANQQVPLKVRFRNHVVGDYFADIIVADDVLVELKAVKALAPEHQAQTINPQSNWNSNWAADQLRKTRPRNPSPP